MLKPFHNEQDVEIEGETITLVLNFRAIDVIETVTEQRMTDVIPQLVDPPLALVGKVLWGLLRERHEGITLDQAAGLGFGPHGAKIGLAMGELISRSFNFGEVKAKNPPKRRGASKSS